MHPVVLRGLSGSALPREEFVERVSALRERLAACGLEALVIYGDARDYATIAWLTGLVPMLRWAVAVVPVDAEVSLFVATPGTRSLAAMQARMAVGSVDGIAALPAVLARFGEVGLAGATRMRAAAELSVRRSVRVVDGGDQVIEDLMRVPSAREFELLGSAAAVTGAAATAVAVAYLEGKSASEALLTGDLCARKAGVHDVRGLWSPDGGRTLRPLTTVVSGHPDRLVFYLATQTSGYWGEVFRTVGGSVASVSQALEEAVGRLRSGGGDVAARLCGSHPVLEGRRIARLGLRVDERVDGGLTPGVYSLRGGDASGTLWSTTVELREDATRVLL